MNSLSLLKLRLEPITDLGHRTDYERDYTAILYSHAFRRLRHKTQVFFFPSNDHICTRLDHSLYVASISSVICRNLKERGIACDQTLAEAIGLGHDLGHTPFGHAGEKTLNKLAKEKGLGSFKHEQHGLRIADKLEKPRSSGVIIGLNLTYAVRDGIVNHCGESLDNTLVPAPISKIQPPLINGSKYPCTLEGCVVRLVDKVAYLGRDIEDAIIVGFVLEEDIPMEIRAKIGSKNGEIVEYFVDDIIKGSSDQRIALSEEGGAIMDKLLKYNYDRIYKRPEMDQYISHVNELIEIIFRKFLNIGLNYQDDATKYRKDSHACVNVFGEFINKRRLLYFTDGPTESDERKYARIAIDFISTLTDRFAFDSFSELFIPKPLI